MLHSVEIAEIYGHAFLTNISWKQRFWERCFYRVDSTKYLFGENEILISPHCVLPLLSVEKSDIYSHWKIFRETNSLVFSLVKTLQLQNIYLNSVRVYISNFHTVQLGKHRFTIQLKSLKI